MTTADRIAQVRREATRRMELRFLRELSCAGPYARPWRRENVVTDICTHPDGSVSFRYGFRRPSKPLDAATLLMVGP